ncbi:MAG TPA: choice-of-anchor X domain-containing protein [Albitalea sp.]|uniref:choice-of-anchor X domain-containing protein n=1 Tax=Piscinibacter sp. TaxID=1903157 RepID=UPI002ED4A94A
MVGLAAWLLWSGSPASGEATVVAGAASSVAPLPTPASATRPVLAPFSASGAQTRAAQRELWQQRLERAQGTLEAYRRSTRYPFESQPIADHPDQVFPNQPISEEHALRMPGARAGAGLRLHTMQERVFVQGQETVRFSVSVRDDAGRALPLRVLRASARELPPPQLGPTYPEQPMNFNDEGAAGDSAAGDGVYGAQLQPAQGFAGLFGQIRVEVALQVRDQQGFTYFDIVYTPEPPARWSGGVREAMEEGSLSFYLKAEVRQAGRYVITGRIDDANGKPFALLGFNEELAMGPQDIRLRLFGKLVRDGKPAFPLTLRDVDGFLLRADAFPDRMLMPRLAGSVYTSRDHALASFSEAEWSSEERGRYLAELTRDVDEARSRFDQLQRGP